MESIVLSPAQVGIGAVVVSSLGYGLSWLLRKKAAEKKKK